MVFPCPFAEQQHSEQDKAELGAETPTAPRFRRRAQAPDHDQGEQRHAAFHQPTRLSRRQFHDVVVFRRRIDAVDVGGKRGAMRGKRVTRPGSDWLLCSLVTLPSTMNG